MAFPHHTRGARNRLSSRRLSAGDTGSGSWFAAVSEGLNRDGLAATALREADRDTALMSVVLFLLTVESSGAESGPRPALLLTKRSHRVPQPGDLCCPGGGIAERFDRVMGRLLRVPATPLTRWPSWTSWRRRRPADATRLATFLAAGLREGYEEMRLNPFGVRFLGILPPQRLAMFHRVILPLVARTGGGNRFRPNWEVERVVSIPVDRLLDPSCYACYRLTFPDGGGRSSAEGLMDFPCFVHHGRDGEEILWGATFRIAMSFLELIFGFRPPPAAGLPVIESRLSRHYQTGRLS